MPILDAEAPRSVATSPRSSPAIAVRLALAEGAAPHDEPIPFAAFRETPAFATAIQVGRGRSAKALAPQD